MAAAGLPDRLALIVVTDPGSGAGRSVVEVVRAALQGGARAIQLRDKHGDGRSMLQLATALLAETRRSGALLFVNDRVDVALAAGADGAHVGDEDLPVAAVRAIAPPGFLIGKSADTAAAALKAEREGADYVGVGPVYPTPSKADAGPVIGPEGVEVVSRSVGLPVVAIGGIDAGNAPAVAAAGAVGVAVIRAVMDAADPAAAAADLLAAVRRGAVRP